MPERIHVQIDPIIISFPALDSYVAYLREQNRDQQAVDAANTRIVSLNQRLAASSSPLQTAEAAHS